MADHYIIDTNVVLQYPEVLAMAAGEKLVRRYLKSCNMRGCVEFSVVYKT
jgi:hypothetical protein